MKLDTSAKLGQREDRRERAVLVGLQLPNMPPSFDAPP